VIERLIGKGETGERNRLQVLERLSAEWIAAK
jgi:hypothetical protein